MYRHFLKVETFLKANKIPYEASERLNCEFIKLTVCPLLMGRSQYGMLPFIELNGEQIADSQIILNHLKDHFKIKPLPTPKDEAIARTIDRLADNHTFLVQYYFKALEQTNDFFSMVLREAGTPELLLPILAFFFRRKATKRIGSGLGQFSTEDFKEFLKK
ncbi:hypothetical protein COOONC_18843, partial [Cooperia oncophora]